MRMCCLAWCSLLCLGCHLPNAEENLSIGEQPNQSNATDSRTITLAAVEDARPAPDENQDCLGLAAACVEKGDHAGAAFQMKRHLQRHPEQIMIRAYLAEILLKLKRLPDAQYHFEQFIAEAQDADGPSAKHVLHCHTRLMEIAQERDDIYGEHLHRGIGMVLLARRLDKGLGGEIEAGFRERLLCKAAAELSQARRARPDEPRPNLYLYETWTKLNQTHSAEKALKTARSLAVFWPMSPSEQRLLVLTLGVR